MWKEEKDFLMLIFRRKKKEKSIEFIIKINNIKYLLSWKFN